MCLGIIEWVYKFLSRGVIVDVFIEVFWFEFNILKRIVWIFVKEFKLRN